MQVTCPHILGRLPALRPCLGSRQLLAQGGELPLEAQGQAGVKLPLLCPLLHPFAKLLHLLAGLLGLALLELLP